MIYFKLIFSILILPLSICALEKNVQVRAGYFGFASHTAKQIYHHGTPDIEVEGQIKVNRFFNPWVNINYIWKEGQTKALLDQTKLNMVTLSFGTKFFFPIRAFVKLYLGAGLSTAYLQTRDDTNYLPKRTYRWSGGVVGKFGAIFTLNRSLFLDLFFDDYYQPVKARSSLHDHVNLGGFRTGLGAGFCF